MGLKDRTARITKANKLVRRQLAQALDLATKLQEDNRELTQSNRKLRDELRDHVQKQLAQQYEPQGRRIPVSNTIPPPAVTSGGIEMQEVSVEAPSIIGAQPE